MISPCDLQTTDSRPSRGAPSPSPPHTHPIQVPPAAQVGGGGVQTCIWDAGSGKQKRTLVERSRRVGIFPTDRRWGTDDGGGPDTGGGQLNTQKRAERGHMGRKERGYGQDVNEGERSPDEYWRGEKEGTTSSPTGQHRKLTLRGQSL